jgi:hypothetical protein
MAWPLGDPGQQLFYCLRCLHICQAGQEVGGGLAQKMDILGMGLMINPCEPNDFDVFLLFSWVNHN